MTGLPVAVGKKKTVQIVRGFYFLPLCISFFKESSLWNMKFTKGGHYGVVIVCELLMEKKKTSFVNNMTASPDTLEIQYFLERVTCQC